MATTPPFPSSTPPSEASASGSSACGYRCSDRRLTPSGVAGGGRPSPDAGSRSGENQVHAQPPVDVAYGVRTDQALVHHREAGTPVHDGHPTNLALPTPAPNGSP